MRVKVIRKFIDLKVNKTKEVGEVLEVTKERFEEINSTSHGVLVEKIEDLKEMKKDE